MGDYTRFLEEEFPHYLRMGMTPAQYWLEDPALSAGYFRAEQLRQQQVSNEQWQLGAYIFQAVSTVMANVLREKGRRPQNYLEEPWRVIPYTEAEEKARAEQERRRVIDFFNRMAANQKKS